MPVLSTVLPIFALIFAGWLARRSGVLGPNATSELNRFVVYLALPALLIDIVANANWNQLWQPSFIGTFSAGMFIIFGFTLLLRLRSRGLTDAAIDALNAAYTNTGFMGFPLAVAFMGADALPPTMIAALLTVCALFGLALILIETGLQTENHPARIARKVALSLLRNPLLLSPLLGAMLIVLGLSIPAPIQTFLKLLGSAASPCALVALGLFLAEKREAANLSLPATSLLVFLKLIAQPLVTWLFARWVFELSPSTTNLVVLLAALPTGTGPFMIAEFYGREAALTSRVILLSTTASLLTITAYLMLIK